MSKPVSRLVVDMKPEDFQRFSDFCKEKRIKRATLVKLLLDDVMEGKIGGNYFRR